MTEEASVTGFASFPTLDCLDRMVISGNIPEMQHHDAMRNYCRKHNIDEFKIPEWASPLRDRLDKFFHEVALAHEAAEVGWNNSITRKDDFVKDLLRANFRFGVIAIIKSMEKCRTFYRAKSKMVKGSPFYLRNSKCVHYYIYINDAALGLVQIRIQTYAPFSIQIIINGHRILERLFIRDKIGHNTVDNCFDRIDDHAAAQALSDTITPKFINDELVRLTRTFIPLYDAIDSEYRFTIRQIEYSRDIYLPADQANSDKYRQLVQQLSLQDPEELLTYVHNAKRKPVDPRFNYGKNPLGSCVRFTNGPHTIKAYHKTPSVLRIETTSRNVTKIRAVKAVTNRVTKEISIKRAQLARSIFDYPLFIEFARLANNRFSQRLATLWDRTLSRTALEKVTHPVRYKDKSCKGFNFFEPKDRLVLMTIAHPSTDISGFRRKNLIKAIPGLTPHQASYFLKRLKLHELIKKEPRSHSYSLTFLGRRAATAFIHIEQLAILPLLAG